MERMTLTAWGFQLHLFDESRLARGRAPCCEFAESSDLGPGCCVGCGLCLAACAAPCELDASVPCDMCADCCRANRLCVGCGGARCESLSARSGVGYCGSEGAGHLAAGDAPSWLR